jgi:hypothetical protein
MLSAAVCITWWLRAPPWSIAKASDVPLATPAAPALTTSYYIDMAPEEFPAYSEFLQAYRRVGCMEARSARGGLVILDFGESRYSKPTRQWGHNAWSPLHNPPNGLGPWMVNADMERAVTAFARGLHGCAKKGDFYVLALGVNNNNYEPVSMLTAGKVWGRLVAAVDQDLMRLGLSHAAWAIGAVDAEAGFGSVSDTVDWIRGYNEATRMSRRLPLLDFGDLECSFNRRPPSCGSGWTLYWHWWVSWGNGHALALPEIYGIDDKADGLYDAQKWRRLAAFGIARTGTYGFAGTIAEQEVPPGHYDSRYAFSRLMDALQGLRGVSVIPVSTNITWCLLDDATGERQKDTWCAGDGLLWAPHLPARRFTEKTAQAFFTRGKP